MFITCTQTQSISGIKSGCARRKGCEEDFEDQIIAVPLRPFGQVNMQPASECFLHPELELFEKFHLLGLGLELSAFELVDHIAPFLGNGDGFFSAVFIADIDGLGSGEKIAGLYINELKFKLDALVTDMADTGSYFDLLPEVNGLEIRNVHIRHDHTQLQEIFAIP